MNTELNRLFIGGDLSGIQKFIYNISSKKAMVSLKGRSAYLNEFMNEIYCDICKLPSVANSYMDRVYCSGGNFYLITENKQEIKDELTAFREKVEHDIWEKHHGQLALNMAWVPFGFVDKNNICTKHKEKTVLGDLWTLINTEFSSMKYAKFKSVIVSHPEEFFNVTKVGKSPRVCAITGIESEDCIDIEDLCVLPTVAEHIVRGQMLRDKEGFKNLEEYADGSYLAILRMDVDGLGKYFKESLTSLEMYKTFSQKLDDFFDMEKGELHRIQQKYKDNMNIVYAGGDDIFAVGRWNVVLEFAADVRNEFVKFINRPGVTISGGVAMVHPKYPIAKAAELAGNAEELAKGFNNGEKNAFTLFGIPISWKNEFIYVEEFKDKFVDMVKNYNLPKGLLFKIMQYGEMAKLDNQYDYIWHTVYYLSRAMERCGKESPIYAFCKELRDEQMIVPRKVVLLSVAARWAELLLRFQ